MNTETNDKNGEALDHWRRIVRAVWALNYSNLGIRGVMPRVASVSQSLSGLKALIPSIEKAAAADILERELRVMMNEFCRAAQLLDAEAREIRDLLSLLEERRAHVNER
jgi:hypothetical protein